MYIFKKYKSAIFIFLLILIGGFFRFYNLNWGSPFYFHPDERGNIAHPILTSKSLFMLDQQNFDTGTFPLLIMKIVLSFFTYTFHNFLQLDQLQLIILISRIISAIISIGILLLLFFIVRKIFNITKAYLTLIFATFSIGFIQFAHFGTIELWEALFFLLLFFYSWRIIIYTRKADGIICGVILGLAMATKISSIILVPAIFLSFLLFLYRQHFSKNNLLRNIKKIITVFFLFIFSTGIAFTVTSLPLIKNYSSAIDSISFESAVALGELPVFYTRSFIDTVPVIFQFTKIYPLILNPLVTLLFIPSLFSIIFWGMKNRNYPYLLLAAYYLLLFVTQSFLFVKWTRYMIPTLPFVYIIIAIAIDDWLRNIKKKVNNIKIYFYSLVVFPAIVSFIFAVAFFSIYLHHDVRITASNWIKKNLPENSIILVEKGNVIDVPLEGTFQKISLFFYDLEKDAQVESEIISGLEKADYFIIQSSRVFMNHQRLPQIFPKTANFYNVLFSGRLGFTQIQEFNSYPTLKFANWKLEFPDETAEETWSVFDHPIIRIFKKTQQFSIKDYAKFLEI